MTGGPREIFDCHRVRAYLDSYLEGQVPPPEARAIRLHFTRCAECYRRVVEREPLQIFAALEGEERSEAFWEGLWPGVQAAIREDGGLAARRRRRAFVPGWAWAAAAALVLLAALALLRPWSSDAPLRQGAGGRAVVAEGAPAPDWGVAMPVSATPGMPVPPVVQEVRSPTARVLSMTVFGTDAAVAEVVLIVDEELEL